MVDLFSAAVKRPRNAAFVQSSTRVILSDTVSTSFLSPQQKNKVAAKLIPARIGNKRCEIGDDASRFETAKTYMRLGHSQKPNDDSKEDFDFQKRDDDGKEAEDDMTVYRKGSKKPYNGDLLPFDVCVVSPPPKYLGRFQLDPRTHCGDIVEHDGNQFLAVQIHKGKAQDGGQNY